MDLEELHKQARSLRRDLTKYPFERIGKNISGMRPEHRDPTGVAGVLYARFRDIIGLSISLMSSHVNFLNTAFLDWDNPMDMGTKNAINILDHILELVKPEQRIESRETSKKIFQSGEA